MGNGASSSEADSLPAGVKPVNDCLYELRSPEGIPEVEIIFFHGLQISDYKEAYWKTWSSDGKTIWPQTLLADVLPQARVLAVSYDSCARVGAKGGRMDIFTIGENLVGDIILSNVALVGRSCPVILVGHSLGGLVIKEFLMRAEEMRNRAGEMHKRTTETINKFIDNLSGIFYYSTPHGGSKLADAVHKFPGNNHDVLEFLTTLSKKSARLSSDFGEWRYDNKIPAYSIAESLPTNHWGVNFIIVDQASAMEDTDGCYTAPRDHINVCKPKTVNEDTFQKLVQFTDESIERKEQKLTVKPPAQDMS